MISGINFITSFIVVVAALSPAIATDSKRTRGLVVSARVCDHLDACYLVNAKTLSEVTKLTPSSVTSFDLDPTNEVGYSVRCDVEEKNGTSSDFLTFIWQDMSHTEYVTPRFMYGSANKGTYINPVPYFGTCGLKEFKVEGHILTERCFIKRFVVNAVHADGKTCVGAPTLAPIKSPVKAPVSVPVKTPVLETKKPVAIPTKSPRRMTTNAPTKAPRKAPITAPVKAPVRAPRKTPVAVPVEAPVRAPRKTPVESPIRAPRMAPVAAPVMPPTNPDPVPVTTAPIVAPVEPPVQPPINRPPPVRPPFQKPPIRPPVRPPVKPDPIVCPKDFIFRNGKCIWAPLRYLWEKLFG